MRRRLLHVITGLPRGGAEMMLYKLLARIDRDRFEPAVVSLRGEGPVGARIRDLDVAVDSLGAEGPLGAVASLVRLRRAVVRFSPHVVQTWLYHADLLGGLAARLGGSPPVVWGIRMSRVDREAFRASTVAIARLCAWLSPLLARQIVCCSEAGRQAHAAFGYDASKMTVIPNGFDTEQFRPDGNARRSVREALGLPADSRLVGMVARTDPHKDHPTFLSAAAAVCRRIPDVHFILVGLGTEAANAELGRQVEATGIAERFHRLGARDDVPALTASFDVAVSSSIGEGFSNAIGEAMACGVPCVVTDVGDSAWVVGETGRVVPPRDAQALGAAITDVLSLPPDAYAELGAAARRRVVENFAIGDVVRRYENLYVALTPDVRH